MELSPTAHAGRAVLIHRARRYDAYAATMLSPTFKIRVSDYRSHHAHSSTLTVQSKPLTIGVFSPAPRLLLRHDICAAAPPSLAFVWLGSVAAEVLDFKLIKARTMLITLRKCQARHSGLRQNESERLRYRGLNRDGITLFIETLRGIAEP